MADYFPLLARALDTMGESGHAARLQVYDRARTALTRQLKALDPPLSPAELERESSALDDAIARAEAAYGSDEVSARRAGAEPVADLEEIAPPRTGRPPSIRPTPRRGRPLALAVLLAVLIVPVAIYAWLQRDRLAAPTPPAAVSQPVSSAPAAQPESKFADRIGGPTAPSAQGGSASAPAGSGGAARNAPDPTTGQPSVPPASGPAAPPAQPSTAAPARAPDAQPALAVAQRAILIEEDPADPQQPKITGGRTLWRLDALNAGQVQPLEAVIRATVEVPEAGLSMAMLMRKNSDAAFPASHTIEFTFTLAADPPRVVRDVAPPQLKQDETGRGTPLAGLSVPVKDNVSLVGLSDLKSDVERNIELLSRRNWIDVPIRFASGRRAVVSFEKGVTGDRVVTDALRQWGQAP